MSKYGAIRTVVDGTTFDSKAEAARYEVLRLLEQQGEISELELQPRYPLHANGVKLGTYVADFRYREADGTLVTEDVKGVRTPLYTWKSKHLRAEYGITILETNVEPTPRRRRRPR